MKDKLDWDRVARGDFEVVITGVAGVYRPFGSCGQSLGSSKLRKVRRGRSRPVLPQSLITQE
jgi:hypothetical protein